MKEVFSYSSSKFKFVILEHGGLFYLRKPNSKNNILRCDNINIAKSYIDGYQKAIDLLPAEAYRLIKSEGVI